MGMSIKVNEEKISQSSFFSGYYFSLFDVMVITEKNFVIERNNILLWVLAMLEISLIGHIWIAVNVGQISPNCYCK